MHEQTKEHKPSEEDIAKRSSSNIRQNSLSVLPWDDSSEQLRAPASSLPFTHTKNTQWPDYSG